MLTVQQDQAVTWDTSDAPKLISNGFSVRLRYNDLISPSKLELLGGNTLHNPLTLHYSHPSQEF
jgi:hypothetical protein